MLERNPTHNAASSLRILIQRHGLFFSDFPAHDMTRDFVLLAEQRKAEAGLKERFEVCWPPRALSGTGGALGV